jgi:hypothetical protein
MPAPTTQLPQRRSAVPPELAHFFARQEELRSAAASLGGSPLVALAEIVTKLASRGQVSEVDGTDLYRRFSKGQDVGSLAVQVSKLRQFIVLGRKCGRDGVDLIRRARAIHAENCHSSAGDRLKYSSTYSALVAVARVQLARPSTRLGARGGVRMLTDSAIRRVLLR